MASHAFGRPALPDARTLRREFFEPILDLHRRELERPGSAKDQLGSLNEEEGTSSPTRGKKAKAYATGSSSSSTSQPSSPTNNAAAAGNKKGAKAESATAGKGFDTSSLGVTKGGANIAGKKIGEKKNYTKEEKQLIEDEVNKALDAYLQGKADGTAAMASPTPASSSTSSSAEQKSGRKSKSSNKGASILNPEHPTFNSTYVTVEEVRAPGDTQKSPFESRKVRMTDGSKSLEKPGAPQLLNGNEINFRSLGYELTPENSFDAALDVLKALKHQSRIGQCVARAETNGLLVEVVTGYAASVSHPQNDRYCYSYNVRFTNMTEDKTFRVIGRHLTFKNEEGKIVAVIRGSTRECMGVVAYTPVSYSYTYLMVVVGAFLAPVHRPYSRSQTSYQTTSCHCFQNLQTRNPPGLYITVLIEKSVNHFTQCLEVLSQVHKKAFFISYIPGHRPRPGLHLRIWHRPQHAHRLD